MKNTNILFVCTGNTCRSPMAEGYLKSKNLKGISCLSAGIFANGEKVSQNSVSVLKKHGIDISNHISRPITQKLLNDADYILCMSKSHADYLAGAVNENQKLSVLANGIPDPYGGDESVYDECFNKIKTAVDKFCEEHLNENEN